MASKPFNVLRVNAVEETNALRSAVALALRNIQHDYGVTLLEIAECIGVTVNTISNAANKKCDLSPLFRQRLEKAYGCEVMNPVAKLSGGRLIPIEARDDSDALPSMTAAIHRLAVAQSPSSDGGTAITHRELLEMLPDLRAAVSAINALIVRGERMAA